MKQAIYHVSTVQGLSIDYHYIKNLTTPVSAINLIASMSCSEDCWPNNKWRYTGLYSAYIPLAGCERCHMMTPGNIMYWDNLYSTAGTVKLSIISLISINFSVRMRLLTPDIMHFFCIAFVHCSYIQCPVPFPLLSGKKWYHNYESNTLHDAWHFACRTHGQSLHSLVTITCCTCNQSHDKSTEMEESIMPSEEMTNPPNDNGLNAKKCLFWCAWSSKELSFAIIEPTNVA